MTNVLPELRLDDIPFLDVLPFAQHVLKGSEHSLNDRKFVQRAVSLVSMPWDLTTHRILADLSTQAKGASRESLAERVIVLASASWKRILSQSADQFDRILDETLRQAITDVKSVPTERTVAVRRKLRIIAAGWFKGWGETLIERRLVPLLAEKLADLPLNARSGDVTSAIRASLAVVPRAIGDLMQPLVRTLISLGILAAQQEEGAGKLSSGEIKPLLKPPLRQAIHVHEVPARSKPQLVTKREGLIYNIVALPDACPICKEIAKRGPFSTERALERIDELAEMAGTLDIVNGIVDASSFVTLEDVKGVPREELERRGTIIPPYHMQCLPGGVLCEVPSIRRTTQRSYSGELVTIDTVPGRRLDITPNHPVLTPEGWVSAGSLDVGSHVICGSLRDSAFCGYGYNDHRPAPISEIAETFRAVAGSAAMPVLTSASDFHGDGKGSEVAVIWSNRLLSDNINAARAKHRREFALPFTESGFATLVSGSHNTFLRERLFAAFRGLVGSSSNLHSFGFACPFHANIHRPTAPPRAYSGFQEMATDNTTIHSKFHSERLLGFPTLVSADDIRWKFDTFFTSLFSSWGTNLSQDRLNAIKGQFESVHQVLKRFTRSISVEKVLRVHRRSFSGDVYNFETVTGWYIANGIAIGNCRCGISLAGVD